MTTTRKLLTTMPRIAIAVVAMLNLAVSGAESSIDEGDDGSCFHHESPPSPSSPLARARTLTAPLASDTQNAEFEHAAFWEEHETLLRDAWNEWEQEQDQSGSSSYYGDHPDGGVSFLNPTLSTALNEAFDHPTLENESRIKSFWTTTKENPLPRGVHAIEPLLTPSGIARLRSLLDAASASGVPTRRPNGMNRNGVIIDANVAGAVPVAPLVELVEEELIRRVVQPVGRMFFPDRVGCGDDVDYFAFTIRYDGSDDDVGDQEEEEDGANGSKRDFELKEHRDASIITLNVNLNLPEEEDYGGSEVYFRDYPSENEQQPTIVGTGNEKDKEGGIVRFSPGMGIIHLGAHRHGSLPISTTRGRGSGRRYNLVIWLFGKDGDVRIAPYEMEEQMTVVERWKGCNRTQEYVFD
mmetsp:Transcript_13055/g.27742  ORF Transcript_13055/g.27742 Transcript_13055/m.27742 type:complete len:410 (-) Transcript_13055:264-1493(-)